MKKRILSVINGYGYGHSTREDSILKLLSKHNKIFIAGYKSSYNFFKNKYPTTKMVAPIFPERAFEVNTLLVFILNLFYLPYYYLRNFLIFNKIFRKYKPNFLISDFDAFAIHFARIKKIPFISVFNFDPKDYIKQDGRKYSLQANYIINNYLKSECNFITSIFSKGKGYVNPIVRDFPKISEEGLMKKLKLKKKPYLIMFGGSKFGNALIYQLVSILEDYSNEYFIIFGYKNLKGKNFISYEFKENYLEYLKVSKGLITLAGYSSICEATILKKPMLIFPIKKHIEQIVNCYPLEKRKIAIIKYLKRINKKVLKASLDSYFKDRDKIAYKLSKLKIKSNGAEEICKYVNEKNL